MSLFAANALEPGIRGVHGFRLDVKRLTPHYNPARPRNRESFAEDLVAIVRQREDGSIVIHVAADVEVDRQRLAPSREES